MISSELQKDIKFLRGLYPGYFTLEYLSSLKQVSKSDEEFRVLLQAAERNAALMQHM